MTDRQTKIVIRICNGESNRTIARDMNLNIKTVEKDRSLVCRENKIHTGTAGVVRFAVRQGIITACVLFLIGCGAPASRHGELLPRAISPPASAPVLSFAWDASPSPEVTGYKLYYGSASGTYTNALNVGNQLAGSITNPPATVFVAATAYDASGSESDFSNEVRASLLTASNRLVTLTVLSNSVLNGNGWVRDARWPSVTLTNPPGPAGFWKLQAVEIYF